MSLATPLAALLIPIAPHHIQPGSCTDLWPGCWLLDWLCGSCSFTIPKFPWLRNLLVQVLQPAVLCSGGSLQDGQAAIADSPGSVREYRA